MHLVKDKLFNFRSVLLFMMNLKIYISCAKVIQGLKWALVFWFKYDTWAHFEMHFSYVILGNVTQKYMISYV